MFSTPGSARAWASSMLAFGVILLLTGMAGCSDSPDSAPGESAEDTITSLRERLRDNPHDPQVRMRLARIYLAQGDGASAQNSLQRVIDNGTGDEQAPADLVRSLLLQEKNFEALETLERLLETDHTNPRLWMLKAEAQLGIKDFDQEVSRRDFLHAFELLDQSANDIATKRLSELAETQPLAAAARAQVQCRNLPPVPIEPPAAAPASGRRLLVGPNRELKAPSDAARVAQDGDLVEIDAGTYRGDAAVWEQNDLILRGVGGMARLEAAGQHVQDKGIWVLAGDNITVENIEFTGAKVRYQNGAGIRLQGIGATIRNCVFTDNENGILGGDTTGPLPGNDVIVEFSRFERNGYGDGQTHNMYIGRVRSFTLRFSYSHAADTGHLVKSRALENAILYNRLVDGDNGNSSYVINLPEGGKAWIVGNELHQGPLAENRTMISFGEEKADREDQSLLVVNNTFYNHILDGTFVRNATAAQAVVVNNLLAGAPGVLLSGEGIGDNNERRPGPWFVDTAAHDYRLTVDAPAIDAGTDPATLEGLRHLPAAEYRHPARGWKRESVARIDIGAHEFCARSPDAYVPQ